MISKFKIFSKINFINSIIITEADLGNDLIDSMIDDASGPIKVKKKFNTNNF